jgi:head-tail adaptor
VLLASDPRAPKVYRLRSDVVEDSYGDAVESWEHPLEKLLRGAEIQDVDSDETETPRASAVSSKRVLFVPGKADVNADDRIRVGSKIWRVDGDPIVRVGFASGTSTTANLVRFDGS